MADTRKPTRRVPMSASSRLGSVGPWGWGHGDTMLYSHQWGQECRTIWQLYQLMVDWLYLKRTFWWGPWCLHWLPRQTSWSRLLTWACRNPEADTNSSGLKESRATLKTQVGDCAIIVKSIISYPMLWTLNFDIADLMAPMDEPWQALANAASFVCIYGLIALLPWALALPVPICNMTQFKQLRGVVVTTARPHGISGWFRPKIVFWGTGCSCDVEGAAWEVRVLNSMQLLLCSTESISPGSLESSQGFCRLVRPGCMIWASVLGVPIFLAALLQVLLLLFQLPHQCSVGASCTSHHLGFVHLCSPGGASKESFASKHPAVQGAHENPCSQWSFRYWSWSFTFRAFLRVAGFLFDLRHVHSAERHVLCMGKHHYALDTAIKIILCWNGWPMLCAIFFCLAHVVLGVPQCHDLPLPACWRK